MRLSQMLLSECDHAIANTHKVRERIPEDKLSWRMYEESNMIGWVAMHLAEMSSRVDQVLNHDSLDIDCVYLRLNGVRVSALYGPSAVEQGRSARRPMCPHPAPRAALQEHACRRRLSSLGHPGI